MSLSLNGKVCLVTGASAGIGLATALTFAKLGAKVAICGRNLERLTRAAKLCFECAANGRAEKDFLLVVQADVGVAADRERVIAETVERFGGLDVLVNNAGYFVGGDICNEDILDSYDKAFDMNLKGPLHLTHLVVPHLAVNRGSIVNVSSIAGIRALPGRLAYFMSKAAVNQMTACCALELASKGIRVNAVAPGLIKTEFLRTCGFDENQIADMFARASQTHPLGRAGQAEEVADVIAFLASDASRFITGAILPVDGGRHATCLR